METTNVLIIWLVDRKIWVKVCVNEGKSINIIEISTNLQWKSLKIGG